MSLALVEMFCRDTGSPELTPAGLEPFLAGGGAMLLFVAGLAANRRETADAAIVARELALAFRGRLRAALVGPAAEPLVQQRFRAPVVPCLILLRGAEIVAKLPGIRDWEEYRAAALQAVAESPAVDGR